MSSERSRPHSIREVNDLPDGEKEAVYRTLLPNWLFTHYGIDPETLAADGKRVVRFRCPSRTRAVEISIRRQAADRDPMLYLSMADTFNYQLCVLLVVINDPDSPRFNTDVDQDGNPTNFGTITRNLPAEEAAMKAGLAPGQVRCGMRIFRQLVPLFEEFVRGLGHDVFFIEPLAYHNALVFEHYGFSYVRGHQEMVKIHEQFQPSGSLHLKLNPENIFRQPDAWKTIRGRSWAIHDGILGHPFTGFQMYKRLGVHAGANTFPNAQW